MKYFISLLVIAVFAISAYAQKKDSLLQVLEQTETDTVRLNAMVSLSKALQHTSADSALAYARKSRDLSKKLLKSENYAISSLAQKKHAASFGQIGYIYQHKGDYSEAIRFYKKSQAVFKEYNLPKGIINQAINSAKVHRLQGNNDESLKILRNALQIAKKHELKLLIGKAYTHIGLLYRNKGEYNEAINYFRKNLDVCKIINNKQGIADAYNSIGIIHYMQSDYNKALEYFVKNLKTREKLGNKKEIAGATNNIGAILMMQEQYEQALKYYKKYLNISKSLDDKRNMGKAYSNIGIIYQNMEQKRKAIEHYQKSVQILREVDDKRSLATTLVNLGDLYIKLQQFDNARRILEECLSLTQKLDDKATQATALVNLAVLHEQLNEHKQAITYAQKSLDISEHLGALQEQKHVYQTLADAYSALGIYKKAYQAHKQFKNINDSIFSKEKHKQITELETKYRTEKKEQENKLLKQKNELKEEQLHRQRTFTFAAVIVAFLLIILAYVIYRNNRKQKHTNALLLEKNEEINQQKEELQVQNDYIQNQHDIVARQKEQITDSINYASRIQRAMLPLNETLNNYLGNNYFIFHRPRDIVSGDFYWFTTVGKRRFFVAADCTGHGVPGAFMSVVGVDLLNQIISMTPEVHADEALSKLHKGVTRALRQDNSDSRDGMDMGIIIFEEGSNKIEYAGAKMPLFYVDTESHFVRANRLPIGRWHIAQTHEYKRWELELQQPTVFYLYSDGFADQTGGKDQRKFIAKNFRSVLEENSNKPMAIQREILEHTLDKWMETAKLQIDDILVCGIRMEPV